MLPRHRPRRVPHHLRIRDRRIARIHHQRDIERGLQRRLVEAGKRPPRIGRLKLRHPIAPRLRLRKIEPPQLVVQNPRVRNLQRHLARRQRPRKASASPAPSPHPASPPPSAHRRPHPEGNVIPSGARSAKWRDPRICLLFLFVIRSEAEESDLVPTAAFTAPNSISAAFSVIVFAGASSTTSIVSSPANRRLRQIRRNRQRIMHRRHAHPAAAAPAPPRIPPTPTPKPATHRVNASQLTSIQTDRPPRTAGAAILTPEAGRLFLLPKAALASESCSCS